MRKFETPIGVKDTLEAGRKAARAYVHYMDDVVDGAIKAHKAAREAGAELVERALNTAE